MGSKVESMRYHNERMIEGSEQVNAMDGQIHWSAVKSLWIASMTVGGIWGGVVFFSGDALLLFVLTSGITLCVGHSVGMHRKLIHRSFDCPGWLEKTLVYLGTLVGLGGPFTMMRMHDMRDWAQRKNACHDYFGHRRSMITDAWWQMHCELHLAHSPDVRIEDSIASSRFYQFIDKYAMWQQLPWAVLFFVMGGWGWVFWGICMRVAVGVSGHWLVGYFAHNSGGRHWHVEGASVQGYDVKFCGLITFGECWHNNHHAFPGSAKMGVFRRQMDPGWWFINLLACFKLADNIVVPEKLPARAELVALTVDG